MPAPTLCLVISVLASSQFPLYLRFDRVLGLCYCTLLPRQGVLFVCGWSFSSVIVLLQAAISWCCVFFMFRRLHLLHSWLRVCWPLCSAAGSSRGLPGSNRIMVLRGIARAACCDDVATACTFLLRPLARIILPLRSVFRWAPLLRAQLAQRFLILPPSLCWCLAVFAFERPYSVLLALPPLTFLHALACLMICAGEACGVSAGRRLFALCFFALSLPRSCAEPSS